VPFGHVGEQGFLHRADVLDGCRVADAALGRDPDDAGAAVVRIVAVELQTVRSLCER
jgi:hypothetical protein